ncbi:MAG: alcohol dehydrogenase catalytic domain-containing protein, partial [Pseudomonadota bacterium]|nr:alcohol dehydrogenase catalytic domain-containing protein [Pseudomonadota bacterium]
MPDIAAFAAQSATSDLAETRIHRGDPASNEVAIDIEYCGVCHSDLHTARDDWGGTQYPCVPGHEIVGRVVKVGANVSKFAVGQRVGVGCMVDSCQSCASCDAGLEQYCETGMTGTYNSALPQGGYTYGGYSKHI